MSDEKPQGVAGTLAGWMKALISSVIGLVSGAVLMYLTPLVNNAIKPPKPVANFATQTTGLSVDFNNRSTGGVQGWWDFGDGSALEPFDPKTENVNHAYAKPGSYSVKLSLANLLGEENDRTAAVIVTADSAAAAGPAIDQFDLHPLDRRQVAPANYQLTGKVKNADYCILCYGDARPMEILDATVAQHRYVTFEQAGKYTIRLAAVNGKQVIEQTRTIQVGANDGSTPLAKLIVTYDAVHVERFVKPDWIHAGWQGDTKQAISPFRKERLADPGCTIVSAELASKDDKSVRNLKAEISADKKKVVVSGELVRPTGVMAPSGAAPHWVGELKLGMERRGKQQTINRGDIAMSVDFNTVMRLPMQPMHDRYEIVGKKVTLQLWDGSRKVWEGDKAVTNAPVTIGNKTCLVTMAPQSDCVVLTISRTSTAIQPVGGFDLKPIPLPKS
jgi:PKD repeat protein